MTSALVVEDDDALRRVVVRLLSNMDIDVREAGTLAEGEAALTDEPDVVLLDLHLPDGDGRTVLRGRRDHPTWVPVIVVSGSDDLDSMVEVIQLGAYDYLVKPPDLDALRRVIDRALSERRARAGSHGGTAEVRNRSPLVGRSAQMFSVFKQIAHASSSDATVLVTGETGSGKELVARAVHAASDRRDEPFVAVNCAALSRELLSSELFGHTRGSFTGATCDKPGRFEVVGRGTLFLDEIGEMDAGLQAALLRTLQERTFERVGETKSRRFDGRVIAATNRDLSREIDAGNFRADLYYRLCVVEIAIPPLRDRLEDIGPIVQSLVPRVAAEIGTAPVVVPDEVVRHLEQHSWPGNVRELRNLLQRLTVMAPGSVVTPEHLERSGFRSVSRIHHGRGPDPTWSLAQLEADHIERVLEATSWHKKRSAEILGISRPTLDRKIRDYGIRRGA